MIVSIGMGSSHLFPFLSSVSMTFFMFPWLSKMLLVSEGETEDLSPYGKLLEDTCLISESHWEVETQCGGGANRRGDSHTSYTNGGYYFRYIGDFTHTQLIAGQWEDSGESREGSSFSQ